MLPKVCIVLLNWNNLNDTLTCLESISHLTYLQKDIIVIDNGSEKDPKIKIKEKFPDIVYLRNERNLGYTGGNNLGIRVSQNRGADYIWLLNNDTLIEPESLGLLVQAGESQPSVALLSPSIRYDKISNSKYLGTYLDLETITKRNFRNLNELNVVEKSEPEKICLWGTSLLIKANLIDAIGYLDDKYFAYYEDMDYSIRATKAGFLNKVVPEAEILHKEKARNRCDYPDYYHFYMTRNEWFFWKKYLEKEQFKKFRSRYISRVIRKVAGYHDESSFISARACLDGLWCAIKNRDGIREKNDRMPNFLAKLIMWHPYFLSRIIGRT